MSHFDTKPLPRDDRDLDELQPATIITTTQDQPSARERVVEALARLLAARPGE